MTYEEYENAVSSFGLVVRKDTVADCTFPLNQYEYDNQFTHYEHYGKKVCLTNVLERKLNMENKRKIRYYTSKNKLMIAINKQMKLYKELQVKMKLNEIEKDFK